MEPVDIREALEELIQDTARLRSIHCPHGCLIAVSTTGCEHGHAIGGQEMDALEQGTRLVGIAQSVSSYYDALCNTGFSADTALELTRQMQTSLTLMRLA